MHWRRDDISDPAHNTCKWILEDESYKTWYKDARGLLWIKGNPGAGKSTVLKYALEAAKENEEGLLASFFFHGRGSLIQKSPLGLFRSLLHQILQQNPRLLTEFASLYRQRCDTEGQNGQKWDWGERDLQKFFSSHIAKTAKTFAMRLYIDALDECGQDAAISLVDFFSHIADSIAICFACRHYPIISFEEAGIEISVEQRNTADIDTYITRRIQAAVRNEMSATAIRHEIIGRSAGNFQWVVLVTLRVIQSYRNGKSLSAICTLIRMLPSELASLYEEIVRGAEPDDMRQALHLFQWICFAFRPLTLPELREATAIDIHSSHTSLKESRTSGQYVETDEDMERRVVSLSQGLVETETHGSERTVQFIHQSVMDFLLQQGFRLLFERLPGDRLNGSIVARGHFLISRACIKYISMDEATSFRITALGLVNSRSALIKERFKRFVLTEYAFKYLFSHLKIVEVENVPQDDLIAFLQSQIMPLPAPHERVSAIHLASQFGLMSVVSCILERDTQNTEVAARTSEGVTPLHYAANLGHLAIVRLLLANGAEKDAKTIHDSTSNTPLHCAAGGGHEGVVHLLLDAGAAVGVIDRQGRTPMHCAAGGGHKGVVHLLLDAGAAVGVIDRQGQTPLHDAAGGGHKGVIHLLLDAGAAVGVIDRQGQTPLHDAAGGGHQLPEFDFRYREKIPILAAAFQRYAELVELLLSRGAKLDTVDCFGRTPLSTAVDRGLFPIVESLLQKGALSNITAKDGRTLFSRAVEKGCEPVVRLLLEHGADPNSPLRFAPHKSYEKIVELLLNWGLKADTVDDHGETPLLNAIHGENRPVVELLLGRGAQINTKNESGWTPISLAFQNADESILRLLLERGADPNSISDLEIAIAATDGRHHLVVKIIKCAKKGKPLPSKLKGS